MWLSLRLLLRLHADFPELYVAPQVQHVPVWPGLSGSQTSLQSRPEGLENINHPVNKTDWVHTYKIQCISLRST